MMRLLDLPFVATRRLGRTSTLRTAVRYFPDHSTRFERSIRARHVHTGNSSTKSASAFLPITSHKTWASLAVLISSIVVANYANSGAPPGIPLVASKPRKSQSGSKLIDFQEVQQHNSRDDCWVVVNGFVYDLTNFLADHPGGADAIVAKAGTDVSALFGKLHAPGTLASLPPSLCLGPVDADTVPILNDELAMTDDERQRQIARGMMPEPEDMHLLQDFEHWAERVLDNMAWAYYRSAADEENTFLENRAAYRRYFFRPRILRDTTDATTDTNYMGVSSSMPVFISPAAMAKLGHPLGEVNLTKAAGDSGIVQAISINASCSLEEMFAVKRENQHLFFQIYLNKDRAQSERLLRKVEGLGATAIIFTVDVMCQSKRTIDVRTKPGASKSDSAKAGGVSKAISGYQDRNLTWPDIDFIRENTKLPIIVKGVQSLEDVQLCVEHGVQGVIISNHGGRQADYAPAPIDVLYEIRCLRPDLFNKIDIMIDGGVRSGADVVKAVALGAKAVGVGRPILYANGTHGQRGVQRVLEILQEEILNTMCNVGARSLEDLKPEMVGPAGPWVGAARPVYMAAPSNR